MWCIHHKIGHVNRRSGHIIRSIARHHCNALHARDRHREMAITQRSAPPACTPTHYPKSRHLPAPLIFQAALLVDWKGPCVATGSKASTSCRNFAQSTLHGFLSFHTCKREWIRTLGGKHKVNDKITLQWRPFFLFSLNAFSFLFNITFHIPIVHRFHLALEWDSTLHNTLHELQRNGFFHHGKHNF